MFKGDFTSIHQMYLVVAIFALLQQDNPFADVPDLFSFINDYLATYSGRRK